jgi:hypothetical protein
MKKVFNFVTKRKTTNPDRISQSQDGINVDGSSLGRNSIGSSTVSSVLQFGPARFSPDPNNQNASPASTSSAVTSKYNIDTKSGKDKSLSKLHVSVWREDLEKTKKYVRIDQQVKP